MPVLARVYGITPKDQRDLTMQQFRVLQADHQQMLAREGV